MPFEHDRLSGHPVATGVGARTPRLVQLPGGASGHEALSRRHVAEGIARLLDLPLHDGDDARDDAYLVPAQPLLPHEAARHRIAGPQHLFGAVVPHAFIASKVITHPLVHADANAPAGWNAALAAELAPVVLRGWSAFDRDAAVVAATRLLAHGPVRMKAANARGGHGQVVAGDLATFERALDALGEDVLRGEGVVVEEHLVDTRTYSVGMLEVGPWSAAYVGHQRETTDHRGACVYAGSELELVRGGFEDVLAAGHDDARVAAIRLAMHYDAAVHRGWPGFFASRRNYDVISGIDAEGRRRQGVLEQSWRVGGASPAEIAALLAFQREPCLERVTASTHEAYGHPAVPADARIYFIDERDEIGGLVKYVRCSADGRPA